LVAGNDFEQHKPGAFPVAMRSSVLLNGPGETQENLLKDKNISVTLDQVKVLLSKWKETFFDVSRINILFFCVNLLLFFIVGNSL